MNVTENICKSVIITILRVVKSAWVSTNQDLFKKSVIYTLNGVLFKGGKAPTPIYKPVGRTGYHHVYVKRARLGKIDTTVSVLCRIYESKMRVI